MRRAIHTIPNGGYCLAELLIVLAILGICAAAGAASYSTGLRRQEARGAAQAWQAEAAWGQTGVLWQGGETKVGFASGDLSVAHDLGLCGGNLGACAPASSVSANVPRWRTAAGAEVTFGGTLASPDAGGSLYFEALGGAYKVVVRPESGLTARSWVER